MLKHGEASWARGTVTGEYKSWLAMKDRCNNPNNRNYHQYGGRGIRVSPRWNDYMAFLSDMGKKPSPSHTLDRIDNDGNYTAENCRWATKKQQANNRRCPAGLVHTCPACGHQFTRDK